MKENTTNPDLDMQETTPTDASIMHNNEEANEHLMWHTEEELAHWELPKIKDWLSEAINKSPDAEARFVFRELKQRFKAIMQAAKTEALQEFILKGGVEEDFSFQAGSLPEAIKELIKKYNQIIGDFRRKIEKEQEANFLAKQDILDELRTIIREESDMRRAFDRFNQLKIRWSETGKVPQAKAEDLYMNWKYQVGNFYDLASINRELFLVELKKNLEVKEEIIQRAKTLINEADLKVAVAQIQSLQKVWRETGPIPREQEKNIFNQFKEACNAIYLRREETQELLAKERNQNLEKKQRMLSRVEEWAMAEVNDLKAWRSMEKQLLELFAEWKQCGTVPRKYSNEIWERFKNARRSIMRKRNALHKQLQSTYSENLNKKIALCEKAEAIMNQCDWKETGRRMVQLQHEWKKIGHVERNQSDAVWNRFRAACDHFFKARETWFLGQEDRDKDEIAAREELISQLAQVKPIQDDTQASLELLNPFLEKWNAESSLNSNAKKRLDKEWNDTLNRFYASLNINEVKLNRISYKRKIEALLANPNPLGSLRDERSFVGNKLRKLEEEATTMENNLLFFGKSKGADDLKKEYETKIARIKEEMVKWQDCRHMLKHALATLERS
jgi:hypothetical protein